MASTVRVELLGPLRLLVDDVEVPVPGPKRRAVLALLALAEGRALTVDHLLEALWPCDDSGRAALQTHISRLRSHLGPAADRLVTLPDAYQLVLDGLDVLDARELLARSSPATAAEAASDLRRARGLWRGPILPDLRDVLPVATAVTGLAALHREITDALLDRSLEVGADVLALTAAAVAEDPLREPAVSRLMRAQAAAGQAPDALATAREFRRRLAEETGLDPSPALDALERDIAAGKISTTRPGSAPVPPRPRTRPSGPLVGRQGPLATVRRLLAEQRLVTIAGPGGVGKTRVALEIAAEAEAATVLLLAPVTDADAVPHALAAALNLTVDQGDVLSSCLSLLSARDGLLVLDNCEHLLDAAADLVSSVLGTCPGIRVLTTSREPLGPTAETVLRLPPLDLRDGTAVFLDRAARVRPGFEPAAGQMRTIAEIVEAVDGMPLAIELAAGRLSTFSLSDLRDRLDRSLDLLGAVRGSGDARHRTLRATVQWSYDLLDADGQRLFCHLAVFPDGADLATAERIAADLKLRADPGTVLARLVDASMLEVDFSTGTRYRMLETLRAFGLDRLIADGEHDDAVAALLRWAADLTSEFGSSVDTAQEPEADTRLRREVANLRAAWTAARRGQDRAAAAGIVRGLFEAIAYRDLVELRLWAIELAGDKDLLDEPEAATLLAAAAEAHYMRGELEPAERLARLGAQRTTEADCWQCRFVLAVVALARAEYHQTVEHALAADGGRHRGTVELAALATAYLGDAERARDLHRAGRSCPQAPSMLAWSAYVAAEIEQVAGDLTLAEELYRTAIAHARAAGTTFLAGVSTVGLLSVTSAAGRNAEALRGYAEVIDYFERTGNWIHLSATLRDLAKLLHGLGDRDAGAVLGGTGGAPRPEALRYARGAITSHLDMLR